MVTCILRLLVNEAGNPLNILVLGILQRRTESVMPIE